MKDIHVRLSVLGIILTLIIVVVAFAIQSNESSVSGTARGIELYRDGHYEIKR